MRAHGPGRLTKKDKDNFQHPRVKRLARYHRRKTRPRFSIQTQGNKMPLNESMKIIKVVVSRPPVYGRHNSTQLCPCWQTDRRTWKRKLYRRRLMLGWWRHVINTGDPDNPVMMRAGPGFIYSSSGDEGSCSPLWTFLCRRRLETTEKWRPQPSTSQAYGFSPVWLYIWV